MIITIKNLIEQHGRRDERIMNEVLYEVPIFCMMRGDDMVKKKMTIGVNGNLNQPQRLLQGKE